jgi:serine/threonine-protein kinase HipA
VSSARGSYQPSDRLFLWWLADPEQPAWIGTLELVRSSRGVSLCYADSWAERGFALSEDLPLLKGQEFFPEERDTAAGAVDDARPDRWGERLIRFLDRPPRLSLLEFLYFAGDDRFGALGVSTHSEHYEPRRRGPMPTLADADAIHELVRKVLANEPIREPEKRLIAPGATLGGARPKALIVRDGEQWVVKFGDGDPTDAPLVEHACMTLATQAGIQSAETLPIRLVHGHAVAVRRFDRRQGQRVHALSAHVALRAAAEPMGYPEIAQLLRRRGIQDEGRNVQQMHELFRRMLFNILMDNTDDHEKNHVLLVNDAEQFELSPAFDVLPSGQALGYQQLRVGTEGPDSTLENALSMCAQFALKPAQAREEIRRVALVVSSWQAHFKSVGVTPNDIELLADQIDRPFLREQRQAHLD